MEFGLSGLAGEFVPKPPRMLIRWLVQTGRLRLHSPGVQDRSLFVLDSVTLLGYSLLRLSELGQREVIRVAGGLFCESGGPSIRRLDFARRLLRMSE
jgi:hypothetical protein